MTHILYFSHRTASSSYLWCSPLKISFHEEKVLSVAIQELMWEASYHVREITREKYYNHKEPKVPSWALWDSRCIVISRIFCLWRFCSYTDHQRNKGGGKIWYELLQSTQFRAVYLMDMSMLPSILPQNTACEHTDTIVELDWEEAECVYVPAAYSHCTQHLPGKTGREY